MEAWTAMVFLPRDAL